MHRVLSRRLALLLTAATALVAMPIAAAPAGAVAGSAVHRTAASAEIGTGTQLAARFRSTRRYNRPTYRRSYPRRNRSRGLLRSFLHGAFWGWMLSHFFGFGYGFPLFIPFLLLVFALLALRRRRQPAYRTRAW